MGQLARVVVGVGLTVVTMVTGEVRADAQESKTSIICGHKQPSNGGEVDDCLSSEPYAPRWFIRNLYGPGGDEPSGTAGVSAQVDIGTRPFLGAFGTGVSLSTLAGPQWVASGLGVFVQTDIVYLVMNVHMSLKHGKYFEPEAAKRPRFGLKLGGQLSAMWTHSWRDFDYGGGNPRFDLIRPEWRFMLDFEYRVLSGLAVVIRHAIDTTLNLQFHDLARWSATVGVLYEWGQGSTPHNTPSPRPRP